MTVTNLFSPCGQKTKRPHYAKVYDKSRFHTHPHHTDQILSDVQLQEFIGQFQETAQQIARKMIDEYHLSQSSKPPLQRSGTPMSRPMSPSLTEVMSEETTPGGTRKESLTVVQDGIVLRFACDYDGNNNLLNEIQEMIFIGVVYHRK